MGTDNTLALLRDRHQARQAVTTPVATLADLLVEAAATLPQPFVVEDLVVTAWKLCPERFGLKGYADRYPDSQVVMAALSAPGGVVRGRKRRMVKVGRKCYSLLKE